MNQSRDIPEKYVKDSSAGGRTEEDLGRIKGSGEGWGVGWLTTPKLQVWWQQLWQKIGDTGKPAGSKGVTMKSKMLHV